MWRLLMDRTHREVSAGLTTRAAASAALALAVASVVSLGGCSGAPSANDDGLAAGAGGEAGGNHVDNTGGGSDAGGAGSGGTDDSGGGAGEAGSGGTGGEPCAVEVSEMPYAQEVISFEPGLGAGFGAADMPEVVLGPPSGRGVSSASLDVVSLGVGGEIVLGFGGRVILDGPGDDLIVFENPFWASGNAQAVWAELGEVSVSADGESWHTWDCDPEDTAEAIWPGCAGWTPTLAYDACELLELDPEVTGGNAFDLEDLGLSEARFVKVRDLAVDGGTPSAGFDLDAVGLVNFQDE